jgi:hypothetical protein
MDGMSLLDVLRGVMLDPAEQAAYNADPGAYLQQYGYDDVDPADLSEAFGLVADTLPPDQAQAAWSAAGGHDLGPFGTLDGDLDGGGGLGAPGVDAADLDAEALAPVDNGDGYDLDGDGVPDTTGLPDADDPGDLGDGLPALSFGVGESDGADPTGLDDGGFGATAPDDGGLGAALDDDAPPDDTPADDGIPDDGAGPDDGGIVDADGDGIPDDQESPFDDAPGDDGGGFDDMDDLDQIDGFDPLGGAPPDDTDIGSF